MWDLTVASDHDFYIDVATTAVLVHNCPNPWKLTRQGASDVEQGGPFNTTFYKSASDGTWWTADAAGHAGSAFKVYEEGSSGLSWLTNADLTCDTSGVLARRRPH
jgi:hypothetical protein